MYVYNHSLLIGEKIITLWKKTKHTHKPIKSAHDSYRYYVNFDSFQKKKTFQSGIISLKIDIHLLSFIKAITLSNSNSLCCCCCCSSHNWNWKQNERKKQLPQSICKMKSIKLSIVQFRCGEPTPFFSRAFAHRCTHVSQPNLLSTIH